MLDSLSTILNEHHGLLNLCFSSIEIIISNTESIIFIDKYHPTLEITVELLPELKTAELPSLAFKKADYANLNAFFLTTDWSELYAHVSLEEKISYFYETIQDGISLYVPVHINRSNNFPYWFSNELIQKIKLKKTAQISEENAKMSVRHVIKNM